LFQPKLNPTRSDTPKAYGDALDLLINEGLIKLEETYPGFPGDVRNPSAFPYPIQHEVAEGLDIKKLIHDKDKDQYFATILRAALRLSAPCSTFSAIAASREGGAFSAWPSASCWGRCFYHG
jgi:hypothetical protein